MRKYRIRENRSKVIIKNTIMLVTLIVLSSWMIHRSLVLLTQ